MAGTTELQVNAAARLHDGTLVLITTALEGDHKLFPEERIIAIVAFCRRIWPRSAAGPSAAGKGG